MPETPPTPEPETAPEQLFSPWTLIGVFFVVFGVLVLTAIAFTDETAGKVVNLICGLVFLAVAAAFFVGGRRASSGD